ncbi:MAG: sigma-70 family RNA polymerase sigma factor [Bacteroidota bacterium]
MQGATHIHQPLVERARKNDRSAQSELFRLYSPAMFAVAMRILNHREEAEDCLQECFIDAFGKLHSFREESGFGSWMKRIVMNRSINLLKKKTPRFADVERIIDVAEEAEDPAGTLPDYSPQQIREAVGSLSDGYRAVFSLYMFEDLPHKEIAAMLGITESTSKSQLNRAKKQLKNLLLSHENN